MTGLKSGSGDDLWGDDGDDSDNDEAETSDAETTDTGGTETNNGRTDDQSPTTPDRTDASSVTNQETTRVLKPRNRPPPTRRRALRTKGSTEQSATTADDAASALDASSVDVGTTSTAQPYIVRRAVQDKSVQFERDERLTFFVHDDVADGERDLLTDLETSLGRDLPKFDVREAVYRAALRNPRPCSKNSWRWATRSTRVGGAGHGRLRCSRVQLIRCLYPMSIYREGAATISVVDENSVSGRC